METEKKEFTESKNGIMDNLSHYISLVGRMFASGQWGRGSISGRVILDSKIDTWYLFA